MGYKPLVTAVDLLGTYHYYITRSGQLVKMHARVQVTEQSNLRYTVKLLEFHADGRRPGSILKVQRRNVTLDKIEPKEINLRLPYKDE